ncbi:GntR family transcriptional regulator [Aquamicrobium sp. LC103]|uniref:GntR family transcriptional regulator n=1 Tax=Aquamicrobium sp. LC103 TaxID=1120658 RepID=UPI0009E563FE|nr:GntR family transcriptional regulator [Aquamicrobium sp. LC103]TKT69534.1 GntR family transcriptional regulator [Aquamicrobium sp. LC103]
MAARGKARDKDEAAGGAAGATPKASQYPINSGDLTSEVYHKVRDAIRKGALSIGERVTEAELAARFGVSRTPVRDAIVRLEADGLLTNEPRRGLIITDLSHQQIVELYFMREVLEGAAARQAAQSASDVELRTIAELNESELHHPGNYEELSEINLRIHQMILLAAHNRYLLRSLSQLSVTMSLLPSLLSKGDRARQATAEHKAIVSALLARDSEAAEAAAREHVRSSLQHRMLLAIRNG